MFAGRYMCTVLLPYIYALTKRPLFAKRLFSTEIYILSVPYNNSSSSREKTTLRDLYCVLSHLHTRPKWSSFLMPPSSAHNSSEDHHSYILPCRSMVKSYKQSKFLPSCKHQTPCPYAYSLKYLFFKFSNVNFIC